MHFINLLHHRTNTILDSMPVTIFMAKLVCKDSRGAIEQPEEDSYDNVLCLEKVQRSNDKLEMVGHWLETLERVDGFSDKEYKTFMQYCTEFFISDDKLWWKDLQGQHKMVVAKECCCFLLSLAHNNVRHHGFYTTNALLLERYWWLHMVQDIAWFVLTCHICQVQKTQKILILPIVTMPAPLFSKVYMDTMHMPTSSSYKFIVQGCCSLVYWLEWIQLQKESAKAISLWILHDIIYRWGMILEMVMDNGPVFLAALHWLESTITLNTSEFLDTILMPMD
jgi:Integrase zinc binding domain